MQAVAEFLSAIVMGVAAATFSWFGLSLASDEAGSQPSVRKMSNADGGVMVAPRAYPVEPLPC